MTRSSDIAIKPDYDYLVPTVFESSLFEEVVVKNMLIQLLFNYPLAVSPAVVTKKTITTDTKISVCRDFIFYSGFTATPSHAVPVHQTQITSREIETQLS